jgi:hypothetical protein
MITRVLSALFAVASVVTPASPRQISADLPEQERLYLIDGSGGILVTYDPVTMERLSLHLTGNINGMNSLTYGQGRLFAIERNVGVLEDQLVSYHPATATATTVGPTGIWHSNAPSVKYDPTRDEFFVLYQEFTTPAEIWYPTLYRIDPATGQMTYINRVEVGQPPFNFFPLAMAICSKGVAYVSQPGASPGIGRLDLHTGQVQVLGIVHMGTGHLRDMSFDVSGRMWALFDDWIDNSKDGIYNIDPIALTFEPRLLGSFHPLAGMNAIAVVPLPATSTFCEPSAGTTCAPTLSWKGLPSATADNGFTVSVRGTPAASSGLMLFGSGEQMPPFVGSLLCFAPPYHATAVAPSASAATGSPCDGTWSADLNPLIYFSGVFAPGDTLRAQWIGLDPAAPPGERRVTSDALEFELKP